MAEADIRNRYSELADVYIRMFGDVAHVDAEDLDFLQRNLGSCGGTLLDAGCGPGHLTSYLTGLGLTARGIDLVPAFIENAQSNWPDIDFAVASLRSLDVPDRSLGGVLAWYSLIHCEPTVLTDVLEEFRRATISGGMLVVGFFEGGSVEAFDHKVTTAYRWPVDEMARRLAVAGFIEVDRARRPGGGDVRPHAVLAARAA